MTRAYTELSIFLVSCWVAKLMGSIISFVMRFGWVCTRSGSTIPFGHIGAILTTETSVFYLAKTLVIDIVRKWICTWSYIPCSRWCCFYTWFCANTNNTPSCSRSWRIWFVGVILTRSRIIFKSHERIRSSFSSNGDSWILFRLGLSEVLTWPRYKIFERWHSFTFEVLLLRLSISWCTLGSLFNCVEFRLDLVVTWSWDPLFSHLWSLGRFTKSPSRWHFWFK